MNEGIFDLIKLAYAKVLRPLFAEKIAQSPSHVDDFVLVLLDKLFDYGTGSK